MPAVRDLTLYEGDDFFHVITFVDADGDPYPVPGTYRAQIRKRVNSTAVLATFVVDTDAAEDGVLTVHLPAADSENVSTPAVWDLERTADGVVTTLLYGTVTIIQGVTRDEGVG